MRLTDRILLIGSGEPDWAPTDPLDSQVYLVETPDGHVVIDAGAGASVPAMVEAARRDGVDPARIGLVLLTHGHAGPCRRRGGLAAIGARHPDRRGTDGRPLAGRRRRDGDQRRPGAGRRDLPTAYRLEACEPDVELVPERTVTVGDVVFEVVPTPGHAVGHLAFLAEIDGVRTLFSGDALFPQGRILLQDTWDCDLHDALRSVERLAALGADRLLAGHLGPVLANAPVHLAAAMERIGRLLVPESLA